MRIGGLLLSLLIVSALAAANRDDAAPGAHSVEIFRCDFGESADTNFDLWPDGWTRLRGPGYPQYLKIGIVEDGSPEQLALRIKLDGGAALVSTPPMPVAPRFSYVVDAQIRTVGLQYDIASLTLTFLDEQKQIVQEIESQQLTGSSGPTAVRIGPVAPSSEKTRYAVLTFHVRPRDKEDLRGEVFLSNVRLSRLPRMTLHAGEGKYLYHAGEPVQVTTDITGMTAHDNQVLFELLNPHGKVLAQEKRTLSTLPLPANTSDMKASLQATATWQPTIDGPGFYRVCVSMVGEDGLLLKRSLSVAVIQPQPAPKGGEFGWTLPDGERPLDFVSLTALLAQSGVKWVKFPAWYDEHDQARAERLAWFAERLGQNGIEMVGLLDQPPPSLAKTFGGGERLPIALVFNDRDVWQPAIDPLMMRLSLKVHWWQLGSDDDTSYIGLPDLAEKIAELRKSFNRYGQETKLSLVWQPTKPLPTTETKPWSAVSYVDSSGTQESLPLTAEQIKKQFTTTSGESSQRWLSLRPLPATGNSTTQRASDLLQRMLAAKTCGINTTFISRPFDDETGLFNSDGSPTELFLPWRTTALAVSGREPLGTLRLPRGSTNQVFADDDEAVMVLWNERTVREHAYLGESVRRVDLWGRETPLPLEVIDGIRQQIIEVGPEPMILRGLNAQVVRWCLAFEFERPTLESVFGREQPVAYKFRNVFNESVTGELTFSSSALLDATPMPQQFRLAPGEERRESFPLLLKSDADSGPQKVRVDFKVNSTDQFQFSVYRTVTVGLDDISLELETQLEESGQLLVRAHVSNRTGKPVTFRSTLFAPDRRRQQMLLAVPAPERTTAIYRLPKGRELLEKDLRLRLEEIGGSRVLNNHVKGEE